MAVQLIPLAVAAARAFGGAARFGAAGGRLGAAARGVAIAREGYRIGTVFNTLANPVVPLGPIRMSLATTTTVYLTMDGPHERAARAITFVGALLSRAEWSLSVTQI